MLELALEATIGDKIKVLNFDKHGKLIEHVVDKDDPTQII